MNGPGYEELLSRARAALEVGRSEEAERCARGALAADPGAVEAHALLARALLAAGRWDDGVAAAEAGLAVAPEEEWLHRLRALLLRAAGRHEDALASADEAARLAPDLSEAHLVRSYVLESLKRIPAAREAAERAVALSPDDAGAHAQLGDLWLEKDPARAERSYREALSLDPERAMTLNNLGVALGKQERKREAALAFRSAVMLDPTLTVAKQNAHGSVRRLASGGTLLVAVIGVTQGAKLFGRLARHTASSPALQYGLLAAALVGLAATWGIWWWRRTVGMRRLAETEPLLHGIYERLEADRKAGRLKG